MRDLILKSMIAILVFSVVLTPGFSKAQAQICETCTTEGLSIEEILNKLKEEGTETVLEVNQQTKNQIDKVFKKDFEKRFEDEFKQLKKEGFSSVPKANNYIVFKNVLHYETKYDEVGVLSGFWGNKKDAELARYQLWIDLQSNEILEYSLIKVDSEGDYNVILVAALV